MQNESRGKYLIKNTAIFAIGNLGTKLINFFMVPLYTYALSTEQYGIINNIISVSSIFIPLITCNIGEAIRRWLLDKDADKYGIQTVELLWLGIGCIISGVIFGILSIIPAFQSYALYMSLYILANAFSSTSLEFLRGQEKLTSYTICGFVQTILIALLNILFLVRWHRGIEGYFQSYIIAYIFCGVLAFVIGGQFGKWNRLHIDKKLLKQMSLFGLTLVPNGIMWWVTNASDKIMVTYMVSASATGIYSISAKLPTVLSTLNTILMQAWQYSAIKESDSEDKVEYNNKMFRVYLATVGIVGAGLLFINRPFMRVYVASEYFDAWKYSPLLIASSMVSTLATFVGTSYYVEKDMIGNLKSAAVGAASNIVMNFILIPIWGVYGAAFATMMSYIFVLIYRIKDTRKYLPLHIDKKFGIEIMIVSSTMVIISMIDNKYTFIPLAILFAIMLFTTKDYVEIIVKNIFRKRN